MVPHFMNEVKMRGGGGVHMGQNTDTSTQAHTKGSFITPPRCVCGGVFTEYKMSSGPRCKISAWKYYLQYVTPPKLGGCAYVRVVTS